MEDPRARIINRYEDKAQIKRPALSISWIPTADASRFAVAHADLVFQRPDPKENTLCYIYNVGV